MLGPAVTQAMDQIEMGDNRGDGHQPIGTALQITKDSQNGMDNYNPDTHVFIIFIITTTGCTAQGGGGSFKDSKPIGSWLL